MIRGIDHLVIAVPDLGGTVEQWVARRGASPFEAVLRAPSGRFGPLDGHRTGGARLVLQTT